MKTGMSGFDISSMVGELQELVGGRIDKAYQLSKSKLLLRIRVPEKGRADLIIVVGKWLYIASKSPDTPKTPSSFAMLLRKHLSNGTITKIHQPGFDRIVIFDIQKAESYQLVCEMFSKGNVILNSKGKIIQPLIPKSWSHREVRAKRDYEFPPSRYDFKTLAKEPFENVLSSSKKDVVRTLATDLNLGGIYSEEVCLNSEIEKQKKARELTQDEIDRIFLALENLLSQLNDSKGGLVVNSDSEIIDIVPFPLKMYQGYDSDKFDRLSHAIEKYLENIVEEEPLDKEYNKIRAKLERQKAQQEKAIINQEKKAERDKKIAELIYANYQECNDILTSVKDGLENKTIQDLIKKLEKETPFKQLDPVKNKVTILLKTEDENEIEVMFDYKKSIEENAGIYYDKVKRAKEKLDGAVKSLKETENKLNRVEIEMQEKKRRKKRTSKQFWFERYRWFISSDGNVVIAGRDAKTNDKIVKKYLTDNDRYAHAEIHGAPSVVIKHNNGEFSEQTLKEACEFALNFSKAWNAKIGAGSAYWVLPDQVSKTAPSGEFIPKGAFIIRGKKNFTQKIEMRLAIGIIEYEETQKIMCAPVSAIENQSSSYVIFEPGDMKKSDFVKKLCKAFDSESEEVSKILPPGNVKITKIVGLSEELF